MCPQCSVQKLCDVVLYFFHNCSLHWQTWLGQSCWMGAGGCHWVFFNSIGNIVRLSRLQKLKMPTPRAGGSAVSPAPLQADELQTNL